MLPLNNQPGRFGDRRFRRERYVFHSGHLVDPRDHGAEPAQPAASRSLAALDVAGDGDRATGSSSATAATAGGYALYLAGRRLHFVNNLLGAQITTVSASVELPAGRVVARAVFTPTGPFQGDVELFYGDVPVGEGSVPRTTPFMYGPGGFAVGYQAGRPVSEACPGRFADPGRAARAGRDRSRRPAVSRSRGRGTRRDGEAVRPRL